MSNVVTTHTHLQALGDLLSRYSMTVSLISVQCTSHYNADWSLDPQNRVVMSFQCKMCKLTNQGI